MAPVHNHLRGRAEVVLPLHVVVARAAGDAVLGVRLDDVHQLGLRLHDGPRGIRAVWRLVATRLSREAAVGVALGAVNVALERVEVIIRARQVRVPIVENGRLGVDAPDLAVEARHHDGRTARLEVGKRGGSVRRTGRVIAAPASGQWRDCAPGRPGEPGR
eukprot:scaffold2639_cov95-Isochrysis_galbana.AAC.13